MFARRLEPEVMDSPEEARDYDAMDHTLANRVFVADFLAVWDGDNPILDVGTGTAQVPIALCGQSATARITAIDLAGHMLAVGRANVEQAGLTDRITLERQDAKRLPYPDGAFAAVISNSIVHHIPEPGCVLAEMVRICRPGGVLLVRDLLRPPDETTWRALVATYAGDTNDHQRQMFADSLQAALSLAEVRTLVAALGCAATEVRQTTDRHWTWQTRRPVPH